MSAILALLGAFAVFLSGLSLAGAFILMRHAAEPAEQREAWRYVCLSGGFLLCGFLLRTGALS